MRYFVAIAILACTLGGRALGDEPSGPYKLWWSYPHDDESAIEIDDPDLHVSKFDSRWQFANAMQHCDQKHAEKLLKQRKEGDGTLLREVRIDSLDGDGKLRSSQRCVMTLADWRGRLGNRLTDRLEDELDAHMSFLLPRKLPGMAKTKPKQP